MKIRKFFTGLVRPVSKNEDLKRQEHILNILLAGSIILVLALTIPTLLCMFFYPVTHIFPIILLLAANILFCSLLFISKKGFGLFSAYFFVTLYLLYATFCLYYWGIELPAALIVYALVIVLSSILIGTRTAAIMTVVEGILLVFLAYAQNTGITSPDLSWKKAMLNVYDALSFLFIYCIIAIISWLSNREIAHSLKRARDSEKELKNERDLLEIRVEERTRELKKAQLERMSQVNRFAEFGKLASGIFHDLINPMTAISLNLGALKTTNVKEVAGAKVHLAQALKATKRMESLIAAVRKQIQNQDVKTVFSPIEEINQAIEILSHRAREEGIQIIINKNKSVEIYGNPLKFNQIVSNLLSNAIDAFEEKKMVERKISIDIGHNLRNLELSVSDNGCGIDEKHLKKIFDPFFTTKSYQNHSGIGLAICKEIIENDFSGRIEVESNSNGTKFIISLPIEKYGGFEATNIATD